jgi:hypothetical protein
VLELGIAVHLRDADTLDDLADVTALGPRPVPTPVPPSPVKSAPFTGRSEPRMGLPTKRLQISAKPEVHRATLKGVGGREKPP